MLSSYQAMRDQILQALETVEGVATERNATRLASSVREILGRLRDSQFNLVVLGQFKRGKTTLINALLGAELLPSAVVPLTSVITFIRHGDELQVLVEFEDGRRTPIALEDLPDYVTERGNPRNAKGVREVEIAFPSEYLREGVRIVDTPGVGSVYEHNTQVAFDFIPRADAAIFLVTADLPISEAEAHLLEELRDYVHRIFFVQNKIDLVDEQERAESLEFSRTVIREKARLPQAAIYPVSARLALQAKRNGDQELLERSLLPAFEKAIASFLMREKGETLLLNAAENGLKLLSDLSLSIGLEAEAARLPLDQLDEKIRLFSSRMDAIRRARNEEGLIIRHQIDRLVAKVLDADLAVFQREHARVLVEGLYELAESNPRLSVGALVEAVNQFISSSIEHGLNGWRAREEGRLKEALRETLDTFTNRTNEAIADVLRVAEDVFGVHADHFAPREDLSEEGRFRFDVWKMRIHMSLAVGALYHLLPRAWVRGSILKQARHKMLDQFAVHCGRARYDFVQRIQRSTDAYIAALNDKIDATIAAVEETIRQAQERKQAGERDLAHLNDVALQQQQRIAQARETLMAVTNALRGEGSDDDGLEAVTDKREPAGR